MTVRSFFGINAGDPTHARRLEGLAGIPYPAWMDDARCAGTSPEHFYPVADGDDSGWNATAEAIALCRRCDVQTACLTYALEHDETYGIWGGLTPGARRSMRGGAA